jgi:hypothetical protein
VEVHPKDSRLEWRTGRSRLRLVRLSDRTCRTNSRITQALTHPCCHDIYSPSMSGPVLCNSHMCLASINLPCKATNPDTVITRMFILSNHIQERWLGFGVLSNIQLYRRCHGYLTIGDYNDGESPLRCRRGGKEESLRDYCCPACFILPKSHLSSLSTWMEIPSFAADLYTALISRSSFWNISTFQSYILIFWHSVKPNHHHHVQKELRI